MDIDKIAFTKDDYGYLIPDEPIRIPLWKDEMELWVESEYREQKRPSRNQYKALSQFVQLDPGQLLLMNESLRLYKEALKAEQRVVKGSRKFNPDDVKFTVVVIPPQDKSPNQYVIVFADTNWKIKYSKFTIELEILFTNNQFQFSQEMTGLSSRLEWDAYFNQPDTGL